MRKRFLYACLFLFTTFLSIKLFAEDKPYHGNFNNYQVNLIESNVSDCIDITNTKKLKIIKGPGGEDVYVYKHYAPEHYKEWKESAVNDDIINLNLMTIPDVVCDKKNKKQIKFITPIVDFIEMRKMKLAYQPRIGNIGWLVRGLEPPEFKQDRLWSEIKITPKGARPRFKYEVQLMASNYKRQYLKSIFLKVPPAQKNLILKKAKFSPHKDKNLWQEVINSDMPVQISEGIKKAASILSAGYAAIGIPGVCAGMHTMEGEEFAAPKLHEDILPFLKKKRTFYIAFDHDESEGIRRFVNNAQAIFAQLLVDAGADVKIVMIPGPEKGADDFILARGAAAYDKLVSEAVDFSEWKKITGISKGDLHLITLFLACHV
jgi:hypothetical protein